MNSKVLMIAILTMVTAVAALAGPNLLANGNRAIIHFADIGNIKEWRSDGDEALLIEAQNGDWYRATFWAPCIDLPVSEAIAFVTEPNGSLDEYSSVLVEGDRCWFKDFQKTAAPASATR